ncbi:Oidioi.mRNA.OKI2018_I69.chr2.g3979.t1.cds [Oikopleura dioica]|uniref:Oidioi.mRNA.OKI2018_I69.chr2.g3979.t1.cds n=1 Tax=Oikopleura dioica TaxID=34765 RepID=A0ABN7T2C2_OIKDI|nr:Oidioi.mRNA.OKI2018_I69.chr2.g3979.t1.cds [Oikopleura dioica]
MSSSFNISLSGRPKTAPAKTARQAYKSSSSVYSSISSINSSNSFNSSTICPDSNRTLTPDEIKEEIFDSSSVRESVYSPASICEENFAPAEDFQEISHHKKSEDSEPSPKPSPSFRKSTFQKKNHVAPLNNTTTRTSQAAVSPPEARIEVSNPATGQISPKKRPQLSYKPYFNNIKASSKVEEERIKEEKRRNPNWPHFQEKMPETSQTTIKINSQKEPSPPERSESERSIESHARIPSSTITTDSGFADDQNQIKPTVNEVQRKPAATNIVKIGSITPRKIAPPTPGEKPKINVKTLRSRAQSPVRKVQEMAVSDKELPPRTSSPSHVMSPTRQRKSAGSTASTTPGPRPVGVQSMMMSGRQTPDDDTCSIVSTDSSVRKISKTGPGRAWYYGYMNNFKGQGSDFTDLSTKKLSEPRPQSASKNLSFMSPPAQPRGRSKEFQESRRKFRDHSVDTLFSRNSGDPNGTEENQPAPRRSKGFSGIRRRFAKKSVDDISKENRVSLHESMIRPEVVARKEETVQDNPDHLELHESQRINTMRAKSKPQNFSKVRQMWKTGDEKGLRGEREIHQSMLTKDELFLTGGVFASVQDDSDRDGGIRSLILCLRDGFILNFIFDSGKLDGTASYTDISTNDSKGLGSHLILRFDEIVDGDPRIDTELFVQDRHPLVGHLINTYDASQKQKPGGSLRIFVGDRSIGAGNVRQANIRYPDGSSEEMKNSDLPGAFVFLVNRLRGTTVQRAQVSLREVQKTPSAKKSSSTTDPFLSFNSQNAEVKNTDDDVYNLLLRKDRPDLAPKEPQKA